MAIRTYEEIATLVAEHNKSKKVSDELVICLIWKETSFDDAAKNAKSSATGLMQITKAAVKDVNGHLKASLFDHSDMTTAAKNIECGTYYLDLRIKWAKNVVKGIEGYGTGEGYATKILKCEECMKQPKHHPQACLSKIHT